MLMARKVSLNICLVNALGNQELVKFNMNPKKIPVAVTIGCLN